jgi:hypothetical protein
MNWITNNELVGVSLSLWCIRRCSGCSARARASAAECRYLRGGVDKDKLSG